MFKRLFSVFLSAVLIVCMSVFSFASVDFRDSYYTNKPFFVDQGDGNTYLGVLDTERLDESQKDYMRDFFAVMTGHETSSDSFIVLCRVHGGGWAFLDFIRSDSQLNLGYDAAKGHIAISALPSGSFYQNQTFEYNSTAKNFRPSASLSNTSVGMNFSSVLGNIFPPTSSAIVTGILWRSGDIASSFDLSKIDSSYNGSLGFVDNDGLLEFEEPEEPSSSAPPAPTLPDIPAGDGKYVPYDTGAWLGFLIHILSTMSTAARIGIIIFASLLGILLIIWVIRWYLPRN